MCLVRSRNGDSVVAATSTCQGDKILNRQAGLLDNLKEELIWQTCDVGSSMSHGHDGSEADVCRKVLDAEVCKELLTWKSC